MSKTEGKTEKVDVKVIEEVAEICAGSVETQKGLALGLANLKLIRTYGEANWPALPHSDFALGAIAFRSEWGEGIKIGVACGKAQQRHFSLRHFVAMVEGIGKPEEATVLVQNFTDRDDKQSARGQILAQINPEHSAIIVWQGLAGRVISSYSDIALQEQYYIPRDDLTAIYVAAKFQVANTKRLDELAAANEGWKQFNIPVNPTRAYDARR